MAIYLVKGEKKDGLKKYRVRVMCRGKQVERVVFGLDNAKAMEVQLLSTTQTSKRMTLNLVFAEFLGAKKGEVKESTYVKDIERSKSFLDMLGSKHIDKITVADCQKWKNAMNENVSEKTGRKFSVRTKREFRCLFNDVMRYALHMEYINRNPLDSIKNFKEAVHQKEEMKFYTLDEFNLFIKTAHENAEKVLVRENDISEYNYYTFFMIAFWMGARKGEINALTWRDIDGDTVKITKSINQKLKSDKKITAPKNSSSIRNVKMPQRLIKALQEQKERQMKIHGFSEDWFVTGGYEYLKDTNIDRRNQSYAKQAGIKSIRIHDYRHSHASLLIRCNVPIKEISRRMGHSNVETTWNIYGHMYPQVEDEAMKALEAV